MDKIEKEKNKIKADARKIKQKRNTKKEIQQNYKIGVRYYEDIEENENKN